MSGSATTTTPTPADPSDLAHNASADTLKLVTQMLDEGKEVVPITRGAKVPLIKWKQWARPSPESLARWYSGDKPADIGVRIQPNEGVLDLDDPELVEALRDKLMDMTLCAASPSGGLHAFFAVSKRSHPAHPTKGVDILGKGSIVIIPPSTGRHYLNPGKAIARIADVEALALGLLADLGRSVVPEGASSPLADLDIIESGERNVGLTRLAGVCRKVGFRGKGLEAILHGLNASLCYPPLTDEEVAAIASGVSERTPDPFETEGYTLHEIRPMDKVPALKEWIAGILPTEGITMFYGLPGQGKTYVGVYIQAAIEWGLPWLGRKSNRGRVVYIDWERRGLMFRRRLRAIASGVGLEDAMNYPVGYIEAKAPLPHVVDDIGNQLYAMNAGVAIIDSLTIAMMGADVKEAKEVVPQLFKLHDWPCTVVVLDHQRKASFGESVSNISPFGSIFKDAVASNVWQVYKTYQNTFEQSQMHFTMRYHKGNYEHLGPGANIHVRLDFSHDAEGQLETVTFNEADAPSPQGSILDAMKDHPRDDGWELSHIMGFTGLSESTSRRWLESLTKEGKLTKEGEGQGVKSKWYPVKEALE